MRLQKSRIAAIGISLLLILGACQSNENKQQDNPEPPQEENDNEGDSEADDTEDNEDGPDEDRIKDIFEGGE
ncbi:hypothetical protein [Oceanobacillus sp. J11TS1]|uniref:hypothetical protein n=1 Tax=Oceanobacillus sp. J11TS1 TaxID=2807191 RepID=UPI001B207D60|nr:hypothetical protein [Oceanobacillus sp. J11TS1]GIO23741.1 hypothetical protein J11TS1_23220 [Oceanobacillus sp. J11TS1]